MPKTFGTFSATFRNAHEKFTTVITELERMIRNSRSCHRQQQLYLRSTCFTVPWELVLPWGEEKTKLMAKYLDENG